MPELRELQRALRDALTGRDPRGAALVVGRRGMEGGQRLARCRTQGLAAQQAELAALFPVLRRLLGEADFATRVAAALAARPPRRPGRAGLAEALLAGLAEQPAGPPWLHDLARLEWAGQCAFRAADDEAGPDLAALAALPPARHGRVVFRLRHGSALLRTDWPVHRLWAGADAAVAARLRPVRGGLRLLVWRDGWRVVVEPLSRHEWRLLAAVAAGTPLAALGRASGLGTRRVHRLLPRVLARGWLGGFHVADTPPV